MQEIEARRDISIAEHLTCNGVRGRPVQIKTGNFPENWPPRKAVEYSHKAVDPMFKMFNQGSLLNKTATCQSGKMDWEWRPTLD